MADVPIQGIEFEVKSNAESAARSISKLTSALKKLNGATGGGSALGDVVRQLAAFGQATGSLDPSKVTGMASAVKSIGSASGKLSSVTASLKSISGINFSNLTKASEAVGNIAAQSASAKRGTTAGRQTEETPVPQTSGTTRVEGSTEEMAETGRQARTVIGALMELRRTSDSSSSSISRLAGAFSGLKLNLGPIKSALAGAASSLGKMTVKMATLPFRSFWEKIKSATTSVSRFGSSLKRILMYRAIRALLSAITKGIGEGLTNLYRYSDAIDGNFAASMDRASTAMQYFKNSVGAMVSPLINALAPVLDTIIDKVVETINVINQLFASLTGASSWTKALKVPKKYAEEVENAGSAAKKALRYLAPFDELNVLPSDNGSGSSGGGSGTDYSSMFEEMPINSAIADFAQKIKDAIAAGDWAGLGTMLGEKVNEAVAAIPWDTIGQSIGYGLNALIVTMYNFLETVDFTAIGNGLSTLFNNAIGEIDFEALGALMVRRWTAVIDILIGFIEGLDPTLLGQKLGDFFRGTINETQGWLDGHEWRGLGDKIASLLNSVVTNLASNLGGLAKTLSGIVTSGLDIAIGFVEGLDWNRLGTQIWESVIAILTNIDWTGIISKAFELLGAAVGGITSLVVGFATSVWDTMQDAFDATKEYFSTYIEAAGGDIVQGIFWGILDALGNIGIWIADNIVTPFVDGFKAAFGIHSPSTVMQEQGGYIIEGLLQGLISGWKSIVSFFQDKLSGITSAVSKAWNTIKTTTTKVWSNIKSTLSTTWNNIKSTATKAFNGARDAVANAWNTVKTKTSTVWNSMKTTLGNTWDNMKTSVGNTWTNIQNTTSTTWDRVTTSLSGHWAGIQDTAATAWSNLKTQLSNDNQSITSDVSTKFSTMKSNLTGTFSSLSSTLSSTASGIKSSVTSTFSSLASTVSGSIENMKSALSGKFSSISSFISNTAYNLRNMFNFQWRLPHIALPHFYWNWTDLGVIQIPNIGVSWYAKGGIVDGATLFGAGEAGKEAVVPLERNTGWINRVADQLYDRMGGDAVGGMDEQMVSEISQGNEDIVSAVLAIGTQIVRAIEENAGGTIDYNRLSRGISQSLNNSARARGASALLR